MTAREPLSERTLGLRRASFDDVVLETGEPSAVLSPHTTTGTNADHPTSFGFPSHTTTTSSNVARAPDSESQHGSQQERIRQKNLALQFPAPRTCNDQVSSTAVASASTPTRPCACAAVESPYIAVENRSSSLSSPLLDTTTVASENDDGRMHPQGQGRQEREPRRSRRDSADRAASLNAHWISHDEQPSTVDERSVPSGEIDAPDAASSYPESPARGRHVHFDTHIDDDDGSERIRADASVYHDDAGLLQTGRQTERRSSDPNSDLSSAAYQQYENPSPMTEEWSTSPFACHLDIFSCCETIYCGPCQLARQYNVVISGKNSLSCMYCTSIVCLDCLCCGGVRTTTCFVRMKVRQKYRIKGTDLADAIWSWCCPWCVTCQHYRELSLHGEWPNGTCVAEPYQDVDAGPGTGAVPRRVV